MDQWSSGGQAPGSYRPPTRNQRQNPAASFNYGLQSVLLAAAAESVQSLNSYGYVSYVKTPYGVQLAHVPAQPGRMVALPAGWPAALPVGLPYMAPQHQLPLQLPIERHHNSMANSLKQQRPQPPVLQGSLKLPNSLSPSPIKPHYRFAANDVAASTEAVLERSKTASSGTLESPPEGWSWLFEGVLQIVLSHLRQSHVRNFRAVCKHWKMVADSNTLKLTPRALRPKAITTLFPRLHTLILTNCINVRNRDLFVLAQSAWSLRTLTVGDDMNKPWVTNRGLSSIAKMTSLTALSLHDCNSVTNNGLTCLNKLRALGKLSLKGCRKITNSGLEVLQHNTGLTSLNVFGCVRISDKGLLPLVALPLRSLHLGLTRIKDEGLGYVARCTSLTQLSATNEDITDAGVLQLTALTNLQALALRDCCEVTADALRQVLSSLGALTGLDIQKSWDFTDEALKRSLALLTNLQALDIRGTWVSDRGVRELSKLTNLRRLALAPHLERWRDMPAVVSCLTQLTALQYGGSNPVPLALLQALWRLPNLAELALADGPVDSFNKAPPLSEPLSQDGLLALGQCRSLTSLDLSRRPMCEEGIAALCRQLPRLQHLHLHDCPLYGADLAKLERQFPWVVLHRRVGPPVDCSTGAMLSMGSPRAWTR